MELNQFKDILSFDGGGSRGILELAILNDVMRLATILWKNPEDLNFLLEPKDFSQDRNLLDDLIRALDGVRNPIHPNDIYDMIVGSSTGALTAFALVGGNCDEDGRRLPMTVEECIKMYKENTKEIFTMSWTNWFISKLPALFSSPLIPYSKGHIEAILHNQFQDCILSDFQDIIPIVGAVARQIGRNERLELFDTRSIPQKYYKTYQVLHASTNAPVYSDTPVKIGAKEFVDGGVGGNCPLAQGIPRAREIFDKEGAVINTALSIAPPAPKESPVPSHFQISYWGSHFAELSTNGYAVYLDTKKRDKKITFRRLSPRGDSLKDFEMNEIDAEKMLNAFNEEKSKNGLFLVDVIAIATFVVDIYLRKSQEHNEMTVETTAKLAQKAAEVYHAKEEYDFAQDAFYVSKSLWEKSSREDSRDTVFRIKEGIADCLKTQGKCNDASILYQECVDYWTERSRDAEKVTVSLQLAKCYLLMYRHKEAENLLHQIWEMQKEIHGEAPNKEIACTLRRLGWCKREQGKYEEAVEYCEEALEILKNLDMNDCRLAFAETLNSLALTYSDQGKHEDAISNAREALDLRRRLSEEENHSMIAESLNNLGRCLVSKGDTEEGLKCLNKALEMKKKLYGDTDHRSIAITLKYIAKASLTGTKKESDSALQYAQQALGMMITCLGDVNSPGIADIHWIVGLCFENDGNYKEAVKEFQTCLDMRQEVLGEEHPTDVDLFYDLGRVLMNQGKRKEARVYFERATRLEESTNRRSHMLTLLATTLAQFDEHLK